MLRISKVVDSFGEEAKKLVAPFARPDYLGMVGRKECLNH